MSDVQIIVEDIGSALLSLLHETRTKLKQDASINEFLLGESFACFLFGFISMGIKGSKIAESEMEIIFNQTIFVQS